MSAYSSPRSLSPHQIALDALSDIGYTNLTLGDLKRLKPTDDFEDELVVMADVRAYFEVAFPSLIDSCHSSVLFTLSQLRSSIRSTTGSHHVGKTLGKSFHMFERN